MKKKHLIKVPIIIILLVFLSCIIPNIFASTPILEWDLTYGGTGDDVARSVVQTSDGGYALAGYTRSKGAGSYDFWLVKTNADGVLEWDHTFGGTGSDSAYSVVQTSDGGYALAGQTRSKGAGGFDFWFVKTDEDGVLEWDQTYGGTDGDSAHSVVQTSDGGYALVGFTNSKGAGGPDFWLVKTDENGVLEWDQTYGGTDEDFAFSVVQTSDGGYAIVGYTASKGAGEYDMWLVKTDVSGVLEWDQTYGGVSSDIAYSVVQTSDDGYAIAGWTILEGAGSSDFWLVKTDQNGVLEWDQTYGGTDSDAVWSMVQTSDGGYALAGLTTSKGEGGNDFWLVKTDQNGVFEWDQTYGGTGDDVARSVVQTSDGGYALAGYTNSKGVGSKDYWLVKLAGAQASIKINPDEINLKNKGKYSNCLIELPEGYDVTEIDVSSIKLWDDNNYITGVIESTERYKDYNNNGILEMKVKIDRKEILQYIIDNSISDELELTVTGQVEGIDFRGNFILGIK